MSVLTVPQAPYHINKITELARDPRPVSAFSDTFFVLANQSSDPDIQKLAASWIVHYKFEEAIRNSSESKVVMCESTSSLQYILRFIQNRLLQNQLFFYHLKVKIYPKWKVNFIHHERRSFSFRSVICSSKGFTIH